MSNLQVLLVCLGVGIQAVSYTHLDVYKRQVVDNKSTEQVSHFRCLGCDVTSDVNY